MTEQVEPRLAHDAMRQRCLPTYVVIDASASMTPYQDTLNRTLVHLHETLSDSPKVSEFAHVSIIAFATDAHVVLPMTDMDEVPAMPEVMCNGSTDYGQAFDLVRRQIDTDVSALRSSGKMVLRPAVFMLTDGEPKDAAWHEKFRRLVDPGWNRRPHVITYGFGSAPEEVLGKVATVAAFIAEDRRDQGTALSRAMDKLLHSLVISAQNAEPTFPAETDGYRKLDLYIPE